MFLALALAALGIQWIHGTYSSCVFADSDEPAYLVTTLMVRDYLAGHLGHHPLRFAENYYLHYPKVALGHWPPGYFTLLALVMIALPATFSTAMVFSALLTAGMATRIWMLLSARYSGNWAWACTIMFVCLAPVVVATQRIMADMLLAWACLEAMIAFSQWLEKPTFRSASLYAFFSIIAILTKVIGIGLLFLPLGTLLSGRFRNILTERTLWISLLSVVAVCAPWYLLAPGARHEADGAALPGLVGSSPEAANSTGPDLGPPPKRDTLMLDTMYRAKRSLDALRLSLLWLGPAFLLALAGAWFGWKVRDPLGLACIGILLGFLLFRFVLVSASWQARMTIPILAPLVCLVPYGLLRSPLRWKSAWIWGATLTVAGLTFSVSHGSDPNQTASLAAWLSNPERAAQTVLVSGSELSEGSLIAETAIRDPQRPSRYVLRADKLFARSTWNGRDYELTANRETVLRTLNESGVRFVVLQSDPSRLLPHHDLIRRTLQAEESGFRQSSFQPNGWTVYEQIVASSVSGKSGPGVRIFLPGLGRTIEAR